LLEGLVYCWHLPSYRTPLDRVLGCAQHCVHSAAMVSRYHIGPIIGNMTSSTKPEIYSVSSRLRLVPVVFDSRFTTMKHPSNGQQLVSYYMFLPVTVNLDLSFKRDVNSEYSTRNIFYQMPLIKALTKVIICRTHTDTHVTRSTALTGPLKWSVISTTRPGQQVSVARHCNGAYLQRRQAVRRRSRRGR